MKIGKRTKRFPEVIKELYHSYSRENWIARRLIIGKKLLRSDKSTIFASDKSCNCAFTSPILDSSCFNLHFYVVFFYVISSLDFVSISLGPFFIGKTKLQWSFAASAMKDLTNYLPKHFNTICSIILWETGFSQV